MIAAWMFEATIVALLFAAGAAAAQRVFALYRGAPVRWVWAAAIAGTFATSALWLAPPARVAAPSVGAPRSVSATPAPMLHLPEFHVPVLSASTERGLLVVWGCGSAALLVLLSFAFVRLARERREWEDATVGGTRVRISESLGPAAVGVLRPRVVIPRWVLALDDASQRAIVAHEYEHQRKRDPALLTAALAAVVLMPWNVGVWMAWRGLRLAVEFDCDERVLSRGLDRARYAQVLLGAWGQSRTDWLASAAFTRGSGLGSRVQHLMRPEPRRRGMKVLIGTIAAAVLGIAACETPAPDRVLGVTEPAAAREVVDTAVVTTDPLVIIDGVRQTGDTSMAQRINYEIAAKANHGRVMTDTAVVGHVIATNLTPVSGNTGVKAILSKISRDSIESIEVLKGNAATAEYGAAARNGVIIIKTKAAKDTLHME